MHSLFICVPNHATQFLTPPPFLPSSFPLLLLSSPPSPAPPRFTPTASLSSGYYFPQWYYMAAGPVIWLTMLLRTCPMLPKHYGLIPAVIVSSSVANLIVMQHLKKKKKKKGKKEGKKNSITPLATNQNMFLVITTFVLGGSMLTWTAVLLVVGKLLSSDTPYLAVKGLSATLSGGIISIVFLVSQNVPVMGCPPPPHPCRW